ncbi:hypothetical protein APSETT444_007887 [Aspergillus pseudonomiae]
MVAQCADEDGWEDLAEVGEAEDEPFACVGWVVDVVIACDGTPRAGDAEDDGEIAQTGTAIVDAAKFAQPGSRREVPGGLSPCHADEYQGNDPGVSFVVVDESEAAKGYEEADRDDNDNTRCEWDRIAGHGDKELTSDYRGNHRVSAIDDDIQQAAKLRSPNAECIAGNCHLAQATGRTQRRGKCGNNGPKESREDNTLTYIQFLWWSSLILWYSFDSHGLHAQFAVDPSLEIAQRSQYTIALLKVSHALLPLVPWVNRSVCALSG